MAIPYTKPSLPIIDQVAHLQARGLVISDPATAEHYLSKISYYRFSGYLYPYRQLPSDNFLPGTTFEEVLNHYLFDREFRLLLFDVIERLEVAFRTEMIYKPSILNDGFWFLDRSYFYDTKRWRGQIAKLDQEVQRSSETFIIHFFDKYSDRTPPAWVSFEVVSLGTLSRIYQNLKPSYPPKKAISAAFGVAEPKVFESWIRSMTYVRNICAHHSRLWNRTLTETPKIIVNAPALWINHPNPSNDKIYYLLSCLRHMLRTVNPNSSFAAKLKTLFTKYPVVNPSSMGFPTDWEIDPFWS